MNRIRNKGKRTTQFSMIIGLGIVVSVMLSGCVVSKKKYEAAVADMESAKIEYEKSQMMREAVEQENDKLKKENEEVSINLEMMTSEIERIKEERESERELLSAREAEMVKEGEVLTTSVRKVRQEYQKLKSQNRALKNTVRRYQKDLKKARQAKVEQAARAPKVEQAARAPKVEQAARAPKVEQAARAPKVMSSPSPLPPTQPMVVSKPLKNSLALVNINAATAKDLVLFLGLTRNMAEKVIANRPYRLRGELVAKNVVPMATFNVIKDRITAVPK